MWKNRVIYIVTLVGATLFLVLYPLWFSWYLMVILLLVALFDIFLILPGALFSQITFSAPKIYEQGEDAVLVFTIHNIKQFRINCLKIRLKSTCENIVNKQCSVIMSENGNRYEMKIDSSRSGLTVYETKHIWIVSFLGLFCIPLRFRLRMPILVLPTPIKPPNTVALPQGTLLRPKPGGGFSDEHDLRPFRFGDTVRSVHWKVSAKLDSLIIREPLAPLSHSRLIHVAKWSGALERDLIIGRMLWVSEYLSKWNLQHYITLDSCGTCAEVTQISDLHDYLYLALDSKSDNTRYHVPAPNGVEWVYRIDAFERMDSEL